MTTAFDYRILYLHMLYTMNSKLVLAIIIILLLLYVIFKALTTSYSTLGTMQKWTNKTTLTGGNLPNSFKANSSISVWFYIKEWFNGASIVTFYNSVGGASGDVIFKVYLEQNTNTVIIQPKAGSPTNCNISEFPLQKWVNLIISFNGSAMDVYVDGKLVKSCVVNVGSDLAKTQSIVLGDDLTGGTNAPNTIKDVGFITNVKLKTTPIAPQEAWDIYSQGFGGSPWSDLLNKYKVKLSFIVDNQEQTSVST
jgi:hypothetical protein